MGEWGRRELELIISTTVMTADTYAPPGSSGPSARLLGRMASDRGRGVLHLRTEQGIGAQQVGKLTPCHAAGTGRDLHQVHVLPVSALHMGQRDQRPSSGTLSKLRLPTYDRRF